MTNKVYKVHMLDRGAEAKGQAHYSNMDAPKQPIKLDDCQSLQANKIFLMLIIHAAIFTQAWTRLRCLIE